MRHLSIIIKILVAGYIFLSHDAHGQILKKGFLVACGEDKVILIDPNKSNEEQTEIIWQWQVTESEDIPQEYYKLLIPLDECKPVMNNRKLLLTSSGGATILLDIQTKKVEFYAKTSMAHSVDLLPGNRIAVANSTHKNGNSLEIYDLNRPEEVLWSDSLYSGHGVVWNKKQQLLYVLGYKLLKAYRLKDWNTSSPSLLLQQSWSIPDEGGHDLYQINPTIFLISTHDNVYLFDSKTGQFRVFDYLAAKKDVKSANYNPKMNTLVYTIAEESWWTHHIYMTNPDKKIRIPHIKLYKVRVAQ